MLYSLIYGSPRAAFYFGLLFTSSQVGYVTNQSWGYRVMYYHRYNNYSLT